jgi:soluble lytic murein transglycosylase-like protein
MGQQTQAVLLRSQQRRVLRLAWLGVLWIAMAFMMLGIAIAITWACPAHAQGVQTSPPGAAKYRAELTRAAHSQWGLDAPIATFAAQVHQESAWNREAVSRVGATGLAQFMPATAQWWCQANGLNPLECQPHNPTWALRALVGYDRYLYVRTPERFNTRERFWVALRGYNGGLGHWLAEAKTTGLSAPTRAEVDAACGRARRAPVHCPENLGYPKRIMALQALYATWGDGV